jgi:hypothetical protein
LPALLPGFLPGEKPVPGAGGEMVPEPVHGWELNGPALYFQQHIRFVSSHL